MEITVRDAVTVVHGMLFGALLLLAFSGAVMLLHVSSASKSFLALTPAQHRAGVIYLATMALLAWATVLIGAYAVYPWYRAIPPAGTLTLAAYPQRLLLSSPLTSGWHEIGMEWKEHIAWFAPISLTAVAALFARYGRHLHEMRALRHTVLGLVLLAFCCTCVAGFFGAMLNKYAPVRGGPTVVLIRGEAHG